jgi:hypothetical protein
VQTASWSVARIITLLNLFIEFSFLVGKLFLPNHCADALQIDIPWLTAGS